MIPNEMKSWREVMDDVARLTKERDEARAEIARMCEVESAELRAARDEAIRLGKERDEACAEIARLRASQNERAIAELVSLQVWLLGGAMVTCSGDREVFDFAHSDETIAVNLAGRIAALRAEQAAAPAPVTPPADAPQRPSVEELRKARSGLPEISSLDYYDANDLDRIMTTLRLLLDDALAARGGAK